MVYNHRLTFNYTQKFPKEYEKNWNMRNFYINCSSNTIDEVYKIA